jgi:signal transduction histidine kinase
MTSVPVNDMALGGLDTVRALLHDLRQPLGAILLLAAAESGDLRGRLDGILDQARWLSDLVEGVIGGAADDRPIRVDVVELAQRCVRLAQSTAGPEIEYIGPDRFLVVTAPVALSRALNCVLDNAVRAAGPGQNVSVEVTGIDNEVTISVIDDGPGLGQMPAHNSLGLTITRALISACGGHFDLRNGATGGAVAQIVLPLIPLPLIPLPPIVLPAIVAPDKQSERALS